jgi:hypothetical protein
MLTGLVQYVIQALESFLSWIADLVASALLLVISHLPTIPSIDWTQFNLVIGYVNAWIPVEVITWGVGAYLVWWVVWSVCRIVLKLVWSG